MGLNFFAAKLYLAIASSELSQASMAYTRCNTPAQLVFGLGQYMELQTISQNVLITILLILIKINYPQKRERVLSFVFGSTMLCLLTLLLSIQQKHVARFPLMLSFISRPIPYQKRTKKHRASMFVELLQKILFRRT